MFYKDLLYLAFYSFAGKIAKHIDIKLKSASSEA